MIAPPRLARQWDPDDDADPDDPCVRIAVTRSFPGASWFFRDTGGGRLVVTPELADRLGVDDGARRDPDAVGTLLERRGVECAEPDLVHGLAEDRRLATITALDEDVRTLEPGDGAAFAALVAACDGAEVDEAFVELDHWAVVGAFVDDELVSVASAFPFRSGRAADLGVLTAPAHRGRGYGRRIVRTLARIAIQRGHEPQYRCRVDHTASTALAAAAGFEPIGRVVLIDAA